MSRNQAREKALPVGLFIIIGVTLLVGGAIWLRGLTMAPSYSFVVSYDDPDRISTGAPVIYRGVQVGRVTEMALAPDLNSTHVRVGISDENVVFPENVRIFVRLEGITGQRYLEIESPEGVPADNYIRDGEIVQGRQSFTWEKIQAQLARIAEDQTLEKILRSTEESLQELEVASKEFTLFTQRANRFLANADVPAQRALNEFATASQEVRLAAGEVRQFANNTRGPLENAIPRIATAADQLGGFFDSFDLKGELGGSLSESLPRFASAAEQFAQNTKGAGNAFQSVERAAGQFEETMATVNTQLIDSELIPNLSRSVAGLGGGLQKISQVFQTAPPKEIAELNQIVTRLQVSGVQLEASLDPLLAGREIPPGTKVYQLAAIAKAAQEAARTVQPDLIETTRPELIREHLNFLASVSSQLQQATQRLEPITEKNLSTPERPISREATRNIRQNIEKVQESSRLLTGYVQQIEPRLASIMSQADRPHTLGGLLGLGKIGSTISGIGDAAEQVDQTAARFDCVATQLSKMLNERFLGFKLFFGKPGAGFEECQRRSVDLTGKQPAPSS